MEATITTRVHIATNQKVVFEYLSNLKYHYLWNPHLRSISSKKQLKLGSTYRTDSMVVGIKIPATNIVNKYNIPNEIEIENTTGTVQFRVNYRLSRNDGKTLVTCTTTVSTDSKAFVFTVPLLRQLARHELQTDLTALKIAIEHRLK